MSNQRQQDPESETTSFPANAGAGLWVALGLTVLVVLAYLALCALLYWRAGDIQDEKLWSRLIYVAGALGGLVTTAVGWLFGREVHRAAAEHATKEAGIARRLARSARRDADAGQMLAKAIKATPDPAAATGDAARDGPEWALSASHLVLQP
jgi:hypothetical protein